MWPFSLGLGCGVFRGGAICGGVGAFPDAPQVFKGGSFTNLTIKVGFGAASNLKVNLYRFSCDKDLVVIEHGKGLFPAWPEGQAIYMLVSYPVLKNRRRLESQADDEDRPSSNPHGVQRRVRGFLLTQNADTLWCIRQKPML